MLCTNHSQLNDPLCAFIFRGGQHEPFQSSYPYPYPYLFKRIHTNLYPELYVLNLEWNEAQVMALSTPVLHGAHIQESLALCFPVALWQTRILNSEQQ